MIYTSGSTGRPRGVLVSHRQVIRLLDATEPWFHFGAGDVWTLGVAGSALTPGFTVVTSAPGADAVVAAFASQDTGTIVHMLLDINGYFQ